MSSAQAATSPQPSFIRGTMGHKDYLLLAVKGEIGIGVKPNVISPSKTPGVTYVGARLRSVVLAADEKPNLGPKTVVHLAFKNLKIQEAWPGITWEKVNSSRASTQIGVFLKGSPEENPEVLVDAMKDKKFATKMTTYLAELVGEGNLILPKQTIIDWIDSKYAPAVASMQKELKAQEIMNTEIQNNLGVFGMQADIMKKAYGDMASDGSDVPDAED